MMENPLNSMIISGIYKSTVMYENQKFAGYVLPETLDEKMDEYHALALKAAENESWNTAVIYAVLEYDPESTFLERADMMTLCVPYQNYIEMASKLIGSSRLFFLRGRKETFNE